MKIILTVATALLLGGTSLFARTDSAISITTIGPIITAQGHTTRGGILVDGQVNRSLGLGGSGGSVRVCVHSPSGAMDFCQTTHVTYPARRPLARSRTGSFATTVQAAPGSTIHVGGCPKC
ncbi:MAG TPA: hypothetical protein VNB29_01105 [Chthoniobacterales bacterium]|nr:hypothetical protein [Chthoniobacterales bacterium]